MIALDRFAFKAKKNNSKKWLYAGLDDSEELLRWLLRDEGNSKYDPAWIDRKTLCQCTGLKDSEGNLIYENDIIQIVDGDSVAEYIVRWDSHELTYEVVGKTGGGCSLAFVKYWIEHGDKCIVVGNVFDKEEK